jgi:hypothetical protein
MTATTFPDFSFNSDALVRVSDTAQSEDAVAAAGVAAAPGE